MLIKPSEFLILTLCLSLFTPVSAKGSIVSNLPEQINLSDITPVDALPETEAAAMPAAPNTDSENQTSAETDPTLRESVKPQNLPIPEKNALVRVQDYIPDILVELKYATEDNFTGQKIYPFTDAYLRYGTIEKLMLVQDAVKKHGMRLKIWDGYRPVSAQFALWEICPNSTYVANPLRGYSSHSRGNTVDITLVYDDGTEVEMPTGFDDFSSLADRDYGDCTATAAENATFLENIMKNTGFLPYFGEWWHFSDTDSYPVEENFEP